jgi:hypothetical protein
VSEEEVRVVELGEESLHLIWDIAYELERLRVSLARVELALWVLAASAAAGVVLLWLR